MFCNCNQYGCNEDCIHSGNFVQKIPVGGSPVSFIGILKNIIVNTLVHNYFKIAVNPLDLLDPVCKLNALMCMNDLRW